MLFPFFFLRRTQKRKTRKKPHEKSLLVCRPERWWWRQWMIKKTTTMSTSGGGKNSSVSFRFGLFFFSLSLLCLVFFFFMLMLATALCFDQSMSSSSKTSSEVDGQECESISAAHKFVVVPSSVFASLSLFMHPWIHSPADRRRVGGLRLFKTKNNTHSREKKMKISPQWNRKELAKLKTSKRSRPAQREKNIYNKTEANLSIIPNGFRLKGDGLRVESWIKQ